MAQWPSWPPPSLRAGAPRLLLLVAVVVSICEGAQAGPTLPVVDPKEEVHAAVSALRQITGNGPRGADTAAAAAEAAAGRAGVDPAAAKASADMVRQILSGADPSTVMSQHLLSLMMQMGGDGVPTARMLQQAMQNKTWADKNTQQVAASVQDIMQGYLTLHKLAQEVAAAEQRLDRDPPPPESAFVPGFGRHHSIRHAVYTVLALTTIVAILKDRMLLDLFSPEVYSTVWVGLAFTVVTLLVFKIVSFANYHSQYHGNPFFMYCIQLVVCFVGTFATIPIVVGSHRSASMRWPLLSGIFLALLSWQWITYEASHANAPITSISQWELTVWFIVVVFLAHLVFTAMKMAYSLGARLPFLEPFYLRHERACAEYVRARLRGRGAGKGDVVAMPVYLPAALWVAILGVGALSSLTALWLLIKVLRQAEVLAEVIDQMSRQDTSPFATDIAVASALADSPISLSAASDARLEATATKVIMSFTIGIVLGLLFVVWLLNTVVRGYRTFFLAIARGRPYTGSELIQRYSANLFHAKWATYFAGALAGNCFMAFFIVCALVSGISILFFIPEFWVLLWAFKEYYYFFGMLWTTRYLIFLFVIPSKVVSNQGEVLAPHLWAWLFPILTVLNIVVGTTNGVIRFIVMFPFMLRNYFRVDKTFMSKMLVDWDWSFQPFLSLVLHAHTRLNPTMLVAARIFQEDIQSRRRKTCKDDNGAAASHAEPQSRLQNTFFHVMRNFGAPPSLLKRIFALTPPAKDGAASVTSLARQQWQQQGATVSSSTEPSGMDEERAQAASPEQGAAGEVTDRSRRARTRWHLYVLLARNPSLCALRRHRQADAVKELCRPAEAAKEQGHVRLAAVRAAVAEASANVARQVSGRSFQSLPDEGALSVPLLAASS